jgi:hypothetical protein
VRRLPSSNPRGLRLRGPTRRCHIHPEPSHNHPFQAVSRPTHAHPGHSHAVQVSAADCGQQITQVRSTSAFALLLLSSVIIPRRLSGWRTLNHPSPQPHLRHRRRHQQPPCVNHTRRSAGSVVSETSHEIASLLAEPSTRVCQKRHNLLPLCFWESHLPEALTRTKPKFTLDQSTRVGSVLSLVIFTQTEVASGHRL